MTNIILASGSEIRARLLKNAGVDFTIIRPDVDEHAIKVSAQAEGLNLEETAMRLAEAKTLAVARDEKAIVIGSDQIMEFDGRGFDKPATMQDARARLMEIQGKTHSLINAIAVARGGKICWRRLERPRLTMRAMSEAEIDHYLNDAGDGVLASVGAYLLEAEGARIFDHIDGDYFAVLGLSLFALLQVLRDEGALSY